ncbi:MAG: hypothetical protein AAF500_08340 [Myxococcota bacterium]
MRSAAWLRRHRGWFLLPTAVALLAEACVEIREFDAGLAVVDDLLESADSGGARFFDAEILRLKGDMHGYMGALENAEAAYGAARDVARSQSTKGVELRIATSWLRFPFAHRPQSQEADEARHLLEAMVAEFRTWPDVNYVRDAIALLAEGQ